MDINKLKWTQLEREVFELLCLKSGEELSQREIAKLLGVSPTAIANSLKKLEKENFVLIRKLKTINFVSLNRNNSFVIELKRAENLKNIYLSELLNYLEKEFAGATIILFGSYSLGGDIFNSDIDIAIVGRKDKVVKLDKFEKILNRDINLNFYDSFKSINKNLKNNLLNGIVLSGGIEL